MEIRKLKPEENVHYLLMRSVCFTRDINTDDRYEWLKEPEKHTEGYEHAWGAFDGSGRLISGMQVLPAQIMINGKPAKAGLVAAVTTLPEARNARCVRKIYEAVMSQMKDEGVVFSLLYPFSFPFYRKFGYEHALARHRANFPISELSKYPYPDGMRVHDKGDPWADFAKVYEQFIQDKNLPVVRGEKEWERILNRDPHKNKEFTYIHYNADGRPDGYVLYSGLLKDTFIFNIREMAWTDRAGLYALLGFIYGMRSEFNEISWPIAREMEVLSLVENPRAVNKIVGVGNMVMYRVVDVTAALGLVKAPSGKGNIALGITDRFMESNTGTYLLTWDNSSVKIEKTNQAPDMEMDVETFAQLIIGYLTPAQTQYRQDVSINSKMDELTALFPSKNLYMMESF